MAVWQWAAAGAAGVAVGAAGGARIGPRRQTSGRRGEEPWVLRHALVVVAVGAAGAIAAFVLTYRATAGADKDRFDVAIKAAAATAALAAGVLTWGRLELSRHEHRLGVDRDLTERYGRAVDQLGSEDELVRVGGVFALERFALDAARTNGTSDVDWRMALGMLAALARKDSAQAKDTPVADAGESPEHKPPAAPTSALEAVQALGRFTQRSGRQLSARNRHNLTGVIAPEADLADADLTGADLTDARLTDARLTDARLTDARLTDADLTRADLTRADLTRADLTRADLTGADLTGADLTDARLDGADLTRAFLTRADLTRALLAGADLAGALLTRADLADASLTRADLAGAYLADADLAGANLGEACLSGVDLAGANLADANLIGANLAGNLAGADLTGANLGGADLTDADLTGANLAGASLRKVRYDESTVWPEGFDPPPSA